MFSSLIARLSSQRCAASLRCIHTTPLRMGRELLITDPCHVTSAESFHTMLFNRHVPLCVRVYASDKLYEAIQEGLHMEAVNDAQYIFSVRDEHVKDQFIKVGSHLTDSGMTSIVDPSIFTGDDAKKYKVSWQKFVDSVVKDDESRQNPDFHYMFFAPVGGDVGCTVYAKFNDDREAIALMISSGIDETDSVCVTSNW